MDHRAEMNLVISNLLSNLREGLPLLLAATVNGIISMTLNNRLFMSLVVKAAHHIGTS